MVWNWMKDWIQEQYDDRLRGYDEFREAIIAAWNAVPEAYLNQLLEEMPARCQAVVNANGLHTILSRLVLIERLWRLYTSQVVILQVVASVELTILMPGTVVKRVFLGEADFASNYNLKTPHKM
jgi:hypothetical protein